MKLHYGTTRELQDACISAELPAGISLSCLLAGDAEFALAGKRHNLRGEAPCLQPVCCAILLGRAEVMTRYLRQNASVRKLNLFLELDWLRARVGAAGDGLLSALTARHGDVIHWRPSPVLLRQVRAQLVSPPATTLVAQLVAESRAVMLAGALLKELLAQPALQHGPSRVPGNAAHAPATLHQQLEACWSPGASLRELAQRMHMSESTLQRRFKEAYGITVIDFLRQRSLESARAELLGGKRSIGEVAWLAGYQHTSNFCSAFKRSFGVTPRQFQAAHAQQRRD